MCIQKQYFNLPRSQCYFAKVIWSVRMYLKSADDLSPPSAGTTMLSSPATTNKLQYLYWANIYVLFSYFFFHFFSIGFAENKPMPHYTNLNMFPSMPSCSIGYWIFKIQNHILIWYYWKCSTRSPKFFWWGGGGEHHTWISFIYLYRWGSEIYPVSEELNRNKWAALLSWWWISPVPWTT